MKKMFIISLIISSILFAQHVPIPEPVFGGSIETMDAIPISTTETRVFVAPRSENSLFYTDVANVTTTIGFSSFDIVPDFAYTKNMGYISKLAADENSQFAFVAMEDGGLWGTSIVAGSIYSVDSDFIEALEVHGGNLFYIKYSGSNMNLYFATINSSTGAVGTISNTKITTVSGSPPRFAIKIIVNPNNNYLYVFVPGVSPTFYKSSDTYNSISSTTTFSAITSTNLTSSGYDFVSAGIAPDGRIFTVSYEGNTSSYTTNMAYSDSDGDPWVLSSISADAGRGDMSIVGDATNYTVYYSRIVSDDKGASWNWTDHADGAIVGDALNRNYAYVRTDWGFGVFDGTAGSTTEANNGLYAVEVNALGMNVGKSKAWVATKSGIFYVYDYDTPTPTWSSPIWPQNDSYPYSAAVCDQTGDLAYVGNKGGKLYRYLITNGVQSDPRSYDLIFDAENDSPYPGWTWTYGTRIAAIAIDHTTSVERIFIGLNDDEDWDETTEHNGAIFMGVNSGGSWTWTQITSTVFPDGLDILDIIAVSESGNTVLYVGVERNTSFSTTTNGIYRVEETSPGVWSAAQDLYLSSSYPIAATIVDIAKTSTDTINICGTDASISNPVIYKKALGDTYWQVIPSYGFAGTETVAKSVTFDNSTATTYIAVDNKIFEHTVGASSWTLFYEYPLGTEINFIYYDDLLVGTGTGLYLHPESPTDVKTNTEMPSEFMLYQNYPNPFNPTTEIKFVIPNSSKISNVKLSVFNFLGQKIATLVDDVLSEGEYNVPFNAGILSLSSGIYFYSISINGKTQIRKMTLLK